MHHPVYLDVYIYTSMYCTHVAQYDSILSLFIQLNLFLFISEIHEDMSPEPEPMPEFLRSTKRAKNSVSPTFDQFQYYPKPRDSQKKKHPQNDLEM